MIRVKPASAQRRAFAQWAVQHRIRTVESTTFGVPGHLFDQIPEELLRGATIDGQPYVPVTRPAAAPARAARPEAAAPEAPASPAAPAEAAVAPVAPVESGRENIPADIPPADSDGFFEDDEPVEQVAEAFENGTKHTTSNAVENRATPVTDEQRAAADELSRPGQELQGSPDRTSPERGLPRPAPTIHPAQDLPLPPSAPAPATGTTRPPQEETNPQPSTHTPTPPREPTAASTGHECEECGWSGKSEHAVKIHAGRVHASGGDD